MAAPPPPGDRLGDPTAVSPPGGAGQPDNGARPTGLRASESQACRGRGPPEARSRLTGDVPPAAAETLERSARDGVRVLPTPTEPGPAAAVTGQCPDRRRVVTVH